MFQTYDKKMKTGSAIIIENDNGEILLQLRSSHVNKFPDHWVLLGGGSEQGETPVETIKREIKEEIDIELKNFEYFKNFNFDQCNQFFFYKRLNLDLSKTKLSEGKKLQFFSREEIKNLKLGFNIREVLNTFLSEYKNESIR